MQNQIVTADDLMFLTAEEVYEGRKYDRKCKLSFAELFGLFQSNESSKKIAKLAGVSHQAITGLYERNFRELFNNDTLQSRWRARRSQPRIHTDSNIAPTRGGAKMVWNMCQNRSLKVSRLLNTLGQPYNRGLEIEGQACGVYTCSTVHIISGAPYAVFSVARSQITKYKFIIFCITLPGLLPGEEQIFIVPKEELAQVPEFGQVRNFYIPFREARHAHRPPLLRWGQYKNAFHLLNQ